MAIEATRDNGMLRLVVSDGGPGFQSRSLAAKTNGIGLANTCERLEQLYGAAHSIEYGESSNGGASVAISIPLVEGLVNAVPEQIPSQHV